MRPSADYADLAVPGPTVTALTRPFWEAAAAGRLLLQRCRDCRRWVFYPRATCPYCWSEALDWAEASGRGRLRTWSTVVRPAHPAWAAVAPYSVGLVGLAEGPTLLSHLLADPADLAPELPLAVRFLRVGEATLPFFEPEA
ncbi:MAG: Zn-ribbon domain-containing OB-fold protein [Devosia sp.]